ncbi:MAG: type II secretion system F family protein [Oceanipulchritudo sp.]
MSRKNRFCPSWTWWIRTGERLDLGVDIRLVFAPPEGKGMEAAGLELLSRNMAGGESVVRSMRQAGMRLPEEAWCLLESGELTGRLGESMREVGELLRAGLLRRRELAGQLWYPGVVCLTGFLVMGLILFWVIPEMRGVGQAMGTGGELPWLTENIGLLYAVIFSVSVSLAFLVLLGGTLLRALASRSLAWATFEESVYRRLPVAGRLRHDCRQARFLRQMGILLKGAVGLPRSLEMLEEASASCWEKKQLRDFRKRLLMGAGFAEGLRALPIVSPENLPLLLAGQEAGRLEIHMERIARELESGTSWRVRQLIRFLEPAILLGLSLAIGGLILAYLLPMVRMFEQLA